MSELYHRLFNGNNHSSVPHRCGGSLSVALVFCFNRTSPFKKRHFLDLYFEFCFVHSGITSASIADFQADKLSVSEGKAKLANGR